MNPLATLAQALPIEKSVSDYALQYGIIGLLCVVFAYIIIYLYKENRADRKDSIEKDKFHVIELTRCQEQCKTEKEAMRADFERRHREVLEGFTAQLMQLRATLDRREDDIRRAADVMIEKLANGNRESADALVEMLQQFLNKVVK